jgi:hypothetical protein
MHDPLHILLRLLDGGKALIFHYAGRAAMIGSERVRQVSIEFTEKIGMMSRPDEHVLLNI